jgi:hypothetical protein
MRMTRVKNQTPPNKTFPWQAVPRMLFSVYFFALVVFVFFWVPPEIIKDVLIRGVYLPFLVTVFGLMFSLLWWLRGLALRALVWAGALTIFILLRIVGLGHFLNAALLLGLLVSLEYYWNAGEKNVNAKTIKD